MNCYVLSGRLVLTHGETEDSLTERTVGVGDVWRNRTGVIHTIQALEDSDVIEASTPYLDDVVRLSETTVAKAPASSDALCAGSRPTHRSAQSSS